MAREGYDCIVVGGGAAGCVLARRLGETGSRSILLIEAGPDRRSDTPPEWHDGWALPTVLDWGFTPEPPPDASPTPLRRGRLLGGTSWLTRFAVRGSPADFDGWAAEGNPGWAFEDVLPAFRRVETDLDFGEEPWHGDAGPVPITRYPGMVPSEIHAAALEAFAAAGFPPVEDHNRPGSVGAGPMPMSSRDGVRTTSVDAYLPPDVPVPGLAIRADAPVASVTLANRRASGVQLADGTTIEAGRIVLAAGTYGSPTILLRSGIGPGDHLRDIGIPVRVELPGVGSNLADHPGVDLDSGWRGTAGGGPVLHTIATFRSAGTPSDAAPDLMFWVSDPDGAEPGFYLDPILLKPVARGSVRLRSADPSDPPRIRVPDVREPRDLDRLVEGYRVGLALARSPAIRSRSSDGPPSVPVDDADLRRHVIENAYSIPHVVGTCAMGGSPETGGVVDALGRVHGVDGLHVIDASIIPDAPSGFPHLITLMLAEHLAPRILAGG